MQWIASPSLNDFLSTAQLVDKRSRWSQENSCLFRENMRHLLLSGALAGSLILPFSAVHPGFHFRALPEGTVVVH